MQLETQPQNQPQPPVPTSPETDLIPLNVIRTETILSKLPIHNLAKTGRVDIQIIKLGPGGEVELKWEVSYNERYGQARQLAYKLDTIVVDQRIDDAGRPLPERIYLGSLNQIAQELGLQADHGTTNKHLKRAFRQNALAGITAKFQYKTNDGSERRLEATFTRYSVIFTGEKLSDGRKADAVYIELNPTYREVLNNAPVRPLNLEYKKQLAPAPQRFYEIVSYKIFAALKYNHPVAKLLYSEYCTFSAQQQYFDYDHFKKQMYKIHRPHLASGYITKVHYEPTRDEQGRLDWIMCYAPGPKARVEYNTFTGKRPRLTDSAAVAQIEAGKTVTQLLRRPRQKTLPLHPEVDAGLLSALTSRGVGESAARKLLADLPSDFPVLDTLEWGDHQIAAQAGKFTNPPGFYISLLRDRMIPPSTFESSQTRTARHEAILREQQAREDEAASHRAQDEAADARLDQLKASDPERYRALYEQAKTQLYTEYPKLATFGRQDDSIHEGAIRASMKRTLADNPQQATTDAPRQAAALHETAAPVPPVLNLNAFLATPQLPASSDPVLGKTAPKIRLIEPR